MKLWNSSILIINMENGQQPMDLFLIIFFLKGKYKIKDKLKETGIENCFISEITIAELKYGAEKCQCQHVLKHGIF